MRLHLEIITPGKVVFEDDVVQVVVPTTSGHITVLPNHVALLTQIAPGELVIKKDGREHFLAITGGFFQIDNNKAVVLADYAVRSEDIEIAKAQEAQKRAEKVMEEKVSEKDFALAQSELRRAILELKVAHRRRRPNERPPLSQ